MKRTEALSQSVANTTSSITTGASSLAAVTLSLPSKYSNYVIHNSPAVSQIESALRSLTYLLPGSRVHDTEIASETLHTFIQLLSIYHDNLLAQASSLMPSSQSLLKTKPSPHARYTKFWAGNSPSYRQLALAVQVVQYTQLLWEMVARRKRDHQKTKWRVVIFLESFKALCRLLLLRLTHSRPLASPPLPTREEVAPPEPVKEDEDGHNEQWGEVLNENKEIPFGAEDDIAPGDVSWTMPRTGYTLPELPDPDATTSYLISKVLTPDDIKPAKKLLHQLNSRQGQMAEVIYIIRPVIYALLLQRYATHCGKQNRRADWIPWLVGFTLEYFSRQLAKRDLNRRVPGGLARGLSALQRDELKKRGWEMGWWTMRGAFYQNITKALVEGVGNRLRGKPLLDLIGGVIDDYAYLWDEYYFSTSTM